MDLYFSVGDPDSTPLSPTQTLCKVDPWETPVVNKALSPHRGLEISELKDWLRSPTRQPGHRSGTSHFPKVMWLFSAQTGHTEETGPQLPGRLSES